MRWRWSRPVNGRWGWCAMGCPWLPGRSGRHRSRPPAAPPWPPGCGRGPCRAGRGRADRAGGHRTGLHLGGRRRRAGGSLGRVGRRQPRLLAAGRRAGDDPDRGREHEALTAWLGADAGPPVPGSAATGPRCRGVCCRAPTVCGVACPPRRSCDPSLPARAHPVTDFWQRRGRRPGTPLRPEVTTTSPRCSSPSPPLCRGDGRDRAAAARADRGEADRDCKA